MASYSPIARRVFRRNTFNASERYGLSPECPEPPRVVYPGDDIDLGPEKIYGEVDMYGLGLRYDHTVFRYEMPCYDPECKCKEPRHIAGKFKKNLDKSDWWARGKVGRVYFKPKAGYKVKTSNNKSTAVAKSKRTKFSYTPFDLPDLDAELRVLAKLLEAAKSKTGLISTSEQKPQVAISVPRVADFLMVAKPRGFADTLLAAYPGLVSPKDPITSSVSLLNSKKGNLTSVPTTLGLSDPLLTAYPDLIRAGKLSQPQDSTIGFSYHKVRNFTMVPESLGLADPLLTAFPGLMYPEEQKAASFYARVNNFPTAPAALGIADPVLAASAGDRNEIATEPVNVRLMRRLVDDASDAMNSGLVQLTTYPEASGTIALRNKITAPTPTVTQEMPLIPVRNHTNEQLTSLGLLRKFIAGKGRITGSQQSSDVFLQKAACLVPAGLFRPREDVHLRNLRSCTLSVDKACIEDKDATKALSTAGTFTTKFANFFRRLIQF